MNSTFQQLVWALLSVPLIYAGAGVVTALLLGRPVSDDMWPYGVALGAAIFALGGTAIILASRDNDKPI